MKIIVSNMAKEWLSTRSLRRKQLNYVTEYKKGAMNQRGELQTLFNNVMKK